VAIPARRGERPEVRTCRQQRAAPTRGRRLESHRSQCADPM